MLDPTAAALLDVSHVSQTYREGLRRDRRAGAATTCR